jgi:hypothetical protein
MSEKQKGLNDIAWEKLFLKYDILKKIRTDECFNISANQIREFREPRLMAKFDHHINLPEVFSENSLAILPVTRGDYIISSFEAYHNFENYNKDITRLSLPTYIQSLDYKNISSEAIALNCALASGIISDFLEDEYIVPTVSGRMGSGLFNFNISNSLAGSPFEIEVNNSQIEIDASYEGIGCLALLEAKRDLSKDFLIRQLYYPLRLWNDRVTKQVKTIFLVYSNGIFRLYEYGFQDIKNYNSLVLLKQKNYSIEDTVITIKDIEDVLLDTFVVEEQGIPFPQANSFDRVINICELLNQGELTRSQVTEEYAFDERQTNYYTDAARYLGLIEKKNENNTPSYSLSEKGRQVLSLDFKTRQLEYCRLIVSHKAFRETLQRYLDNGEIPETKEVVGIMMDSNIFAISEASTFERRSSTVKGWINWIINLVNE